MEQQHLSPGQRQALKDASTRPVGSVTDALSELSGLESRATNLRILTNHAAADFEAAMAKLPKGAPAEMADPVRTSAEATISEIEADTRRELKVLEARARAIREQLEEAAAQPSLAAVPTATLDAANAARPQVEAQIAGLGIAAIRSRLSAARIRDDEAELLALVTVLGPVLASWKVDPDSADTFAIYEARAGLRDVSRRWRGRSLDIALERAEVVERKVSEVDQAIARGFTTRTGRPSYAFLEGALD